MIIRNFKSQKILAILKNSPLGSDLYICDVIQLDRYELLR